MFYNIIPLIFILVCGLVIIRILTKKFPAVANLDVANIPKEKEKRVKQQILNNRFKRNINRWVSSLSRAIKPISLRLSNLIKEGYHRLVSLRDNYARESKQDDNDLDRIEELFLEASEFIKREKRSEAEKIYIEIISLDSKNIEAFKMLGQLYIDMQKPQEAKETLEHVLKLTQEDSEVYGQLADLAKEKGNLDKSKKYYIQSVELNNQNGTNFLNLAEIYESSGEYKEAVKNIKEALKIEPKNPRYLDAFFNLSILNKNKSEALDAYKELKNINPENGKLEEMKKQIDAL